MFSFGRSLTFILLILGSLSTVLTQDINNNIQSEEIGSNTIAETEAATSEKTDTIIDPPSSDTVKSDDVESDQEPSEGTSETKKYSTIPDKPRLITKEELAEKNGKGKDKTLWISIMSEVFDVTSAPQFYSEGNTYNIFVGRDANVPFVTGEFTVEEASKSISTMDSHDLWVLAHFFNETYKQEDGFKYPFVGILIGELYNEKGRPTRLLREIRAKIEKEDVTKKAEEKYYEELAKERQKEIEELEREEKKRMAWKKKIIGPIEFIRKHIKRASRFIKKIITEIQERFKNQDDKANEELLKSMLQGSGLDQVNKEL